MTRRDALWRLAAVGMAVLALDQGTKLLIRLVFADDLPTRVTGFFNIVLVYNKGVSFSLLTMDGGHGPYLLTALSLLICGALAWWVRRNPRPWYVVLAGMIIGGALGNVLDRLYLGGVVDFLDLHAFGWHWPAFNVADCGVVLGAVGLIADGLFTRKPKST